MQLSPKATRFIIEALEHYQASHEAQLQDPQSARRGVCGAGE